MSIAFLLFNFYYFKSNSKCIEKRALELYCYGSSTAKARQKEKQDFMHVYRKIRPWPKIYHLFMRIKTLSFIASIFPHTCVSGSYSDY